MRKYLISWQVPGITRLLTRASLFSERSPFSSADVPLHLVLDWVRLVDHYKNTRIGRKENLERVRGLGSY